MIKQIIRKYLPNKIKLYLIKKIYGSVDEIGIVFEVFKKRKDGIMIDVGAHHGSSLRSFMNLGWKIYAFEPDPKNAEQLERVTEGYSNILIFREAVSNIIGKDVAYYTSDVSSGISGLSKFHESHKSTHTVKTIRLRDIVSENAINKIDLLKIDTEGHDLFVLMGYDWNSTESPECIVCEFEDKKTLPLGYTVVDIVAFLDEKNYKMVISEWYPITEYGANHKWRRFINSDQAAKLSDNSWGNIIAFRKNSDKLKRLESIIKSL
jgi:FkbM family methyltransferase